VTKGEHFVMNNEKRDNFRKIFVFLLSEWKLVILLFIAFWIPPIIISQIIRIPTGSYTIGDENAWVGFLGNYSGGIIGGIVALVVARIQVNKEKELKEAEDKQMQQYALTLIKRFIFQEMRNNLSQISDNCLEALKRRANKETTSYYINPNFSYSTYYELRYELVKHLKIENQLLLDDLTDFYEYLMLLENKKQIDLLSYQEAQSIYECFTEWSITLDSV
jgi:hypothetical protein